MQGPLSPSQDPNPDTKQSYLPMCKTDSLPHHIMMNTENQNALQRSKHEILDLKIFWWPQKALSTKCSRHSMYQNDFSMQSAKRKSINSSLQPSLLDAYTKLEYGTQHREDKEGDEHLHDLLLQRRQKFIIHEVLERRLPRYWFSNYSYRQKKAQSYCKSIGLKHWPHPSRKSFRFGNDVQNTP